MARRISNGHACVIDRVNKRGTRSRRGEREDCEAETDFPAREGEASDRYWPPRIEVARLKPSDLRSLEFRELRLGKRAYEDAIA